MKLSLTQVFQENSRNSQSVPSGYQFTVSIPCPSGGAHFLPFQSCLSFGQWENAASASRGLHDLFELMSTKRWPSWRYLRYPTLPWTPFRTVQRIWWYLALSVCSEGQATDFQDLVLKFPMPDLHWLWNYIVPFPSVSSLISVVLVLHPNSRVSVDQHPLSGVFP